MKIFKTTKKKRLESLESSLDRLETILVSGGVLRKNNFYQSLLYGEPELSAGNLRERLDELDEMIIEVIDHTGEVEELSNMIIAMAERFGVEFEWVEDQPKYVCRDKPADPE